MSHKRVAIIPAKGASQRFPRKNVAKLAGRTLLERTIDVARESALFDRIVVSTEDAEVAAIAKDAGAEVPFVRPADLARDPATILDVTRHALEQLEATGEHYDVVAVLLPTSPLRNVDDVVGAVRAFEASGKQTLTTVTEWEHPPLNAYELATDGTIRLFHSEYAGRLGARASQLPHLVRVNGAVTIVTGDFLRSRATFGVEPAASYGMPFERSIDVDSEFDLALAEFLLNR